MTIVLSIHNLFRWAILIFAVWTVMNALTGMMNKRPYSATDNRSNLFFMICCDIQLLLGLVLYFSNPWFDKLKSGMAAVMKVPVDRFFTVEHSLMMIIAWILVHVGRSSVKRADSDTLKHKRSLIYFGLALVLILAAIPWSFRPEIGRPLFRMFNP